MSTKSNFGCIKFDYIPFASLSTMTPDHWLFRYIKENKRHSMCFANHLHECPDITPDFPCYFYLHDGDNIVASMSAIPDTLFTKDAAYKWAWMGSFLTDPNYRRRGLGSYLWSMSLEVLSQQGYIMGGAFANPITTHICKKLDFVMPARIERLVALKLVSPLLNGYTKYRMFGRVADAMYSPVARFWNKFSKYLLPRGHDHVIVNEIFPTGTHGFGTSKPCHGRLAHFNNEWNKIEWKLKYANNTKVFNVSNKCEGDLFYLSIKERFIDKQFAGRFSNFRLMTLMDYGYFRPCDKSDDTMLNIILELFRKSDCDVLEVITPSLPLIKKAKYRGLGRAGKGVAFWFKPPPGVDLGSDVLSNRAWHFTHFVADAFSFV